MYDLVCSVAIGGIVLVMLVGFNGNIVESASAQTVKVIAQGNLSTVTSILENEFSKMGYRVFGAADSSIIYADSNKIKFIGDFGDQGKVDTVVYSFNPTKLSGHSNLNTRILTRTFTPQGSSPTTETINLGITRFRLWYYKTRDTALVTNPVSLPSQIKCLKVALNVESTVPYKEQSTMKRNKVSYLKLNPGVFWERLIKPKNLR